MSDEIDYGLNRSSAAEITAHLLRVDAFFEPTLSSRVDIPAYAQKLHDRAIRFEAWLRDELVGLVASYCNQPEGGKAFVTSVSVRYEFQGHGIAARLMRLCIEDARSLGFGEMALEVDRRSLPAISLYQKLGFNTLCSRGSTLTMGLTLESKTI